jgi:D-glycero-beta-D-manno-heptose-7-phosphate kinase
LRFKRVSFVVCRVSFVDGCKTRLHSDGFYTRRYGASRAVNRLPPKNNSSFIITHSSFIINLLKNKRILILGDVMLDRYWLGSVTRISPEAPVPVVLHHSSDDRLGGAANVALNIRALGSQPVLCSVVGADEAGTAFRALLPGLGIGQEGIVTSGTRKTTVKTRILGNNQQMLRIDQEDTHPLSDAASEQLYRAVLALVEETSIDAIILQDYNKGVLTADLIGRVVQLAREKGIPTAVDPKKDNFFAFQGVDLFKPNLKEIRDSAPFGVQPDVESLHQAATFLEEQLGHRYTMITLSERGLFLKARDSEGMLYPTEPRTIADVSGAGDTVISIAALCLAAGIDLPMMARLANLAGGQVCEFPGVVPVQPDILERELNNDYSKR